MTTTIHTAENGFRSVRTIQDLRRGEIVIDLTEAKVVSQPTQTSIRISPGKHAEHEVGQFVNHSCTPSCEVIGPYVVALRDIPVGTEVTFDYTENEEASLAAPFTCGECGKQFAGGEKPCLEK